MLLIAIWDNMNCKCVHLWGAMSLLSLFLTIQAVFASAQEPNNGRFELFDTSNPDFNTPTGWQHENYTAVVSHFVPNPLTPEEGQGIEPHWLLDPCIGLFPYEGNHFLVLSTGDINNHPEVRYAKVWQTIPVAAGDTLIGAYFFGTYEAPLTVYNDYAEIKLVDPNLRGIVLVHVDVEDVGVLSSMKGWKRFEYTFDANQAGTYDLTIRVQDWDDQRYNSYFAVDGLVLCENASGGGDINLDCTTNFQDFALFAAGWFCNCNDPNNYNDPDPNSSCRLDIDLAGGGLVDTNDLQIMAEHWLEGTKE